MNKLFIAIVFFLCSLNFNTKSNAQYFSAKDKSRLYYMSELSVHKGHIKKYSTEIYFDVNQNKNGWAAMPDSRYIISNLTFDKNGDITSIDMFNHMEDTLITTHYTYKKLHENNYAISRENKPFGTISIKLINDSTLTITQTDKDGKIVSISTSEFNQQLQRIVNNSKIYSGDAIISHSLYGYVYDEYGFAFSQYYVDMLQEGLETITNTQLESDNKGNTTKALSSSDNSDTTLAIYSYEYYDNN